MTRSSCWLSSTASFLALAGCGDSLPSTADRPEPSFLVNATWDGNNHPAVGAMLYDWGGDGIDGTDLMCSGSLIAPTVFLTSAHCILFFPPGTEFWVTFDSDLLDDPQNLNSLIQVSSAIASPNYKPSVGGNIHDLGVLLLPAGSTAGITPVSLPTLGLLNAMEKQLKHTGVVQVGYGSSATAKGTPVFSWDGRRNAGLAPFQSLTPFQLLLQTNTTSTGMSGECYGDSGSPKFLAGTNMAVSVASWGDIPCRATAWSYRLDTEFARGFLSGFVSLP